MRTSADINGVPLDEGLFSWPLYRGTEARRVVIHGFGPKWDDYNAMVSALKGSPATITVRGVAGPGHSGGQEEIVIPEVYVARATRVNSASVELWCYDARLLLTRRVGDMDFNMEFGDGILDGTEFETYQDAIRAYCERVDVLNDRMASDAYDAIPPRELEPNMHLSALVAADPLAILCERAGVDLTVGVDGKFYFASREDATPQWFTGYEDYHWLVRPGFMALESTIGQRPREIISYYWEHHTLRLEGADPNSTVAGYGPPETRAQLTQVYLYNGEYLTLEELLIAVAGGTAITDAQIAASFLSDSADGSPLHPLDTFASKLVWAIIRRDWRRLWRIEFPNGSTGGWDNWRFGKLNDDGSVTPTSVECPWVEFTRVVRAGTGESIEGKPWTTNHDAPAPFKARWDDGPESSVIRIVPDQGDDRIGDLIAPMPGALQVSRPNGGPTDALIIETKNELNNEKVSASIRNLNLVGREDISKGRFRTSFHLYVYLTARRFMPNDKTRWHSETVEAFSDGDIPVVELPPSEDLQCYRSYVGGDQGPGTVEDDGLGQKLNNLILHEDGIRRAEVWKAVHSQSAEGQGRADTIALGKRKRLIDGPIIEAAIVVEGPQTYTEVAVGNIADARTQDMLAARRIAARKVNVQGVPIV